MRATLRRWAGAGDEGSRIFYDGLLNSSVVNCWHVMGGLNKINEGKGRLGPPKDDQS